MQPTIITVSDYEEFDDMFTISPSNLNIQFWSPFKMPGSLLPALINEYGEPSEIVGRDFTVTMP